MEFLGIALAVILAVGIGILFLVNQPKRKSGFRRSNGLSKNEIRERWQKVEETFSLGGPSNFKSAIMEADKLVDYALLVKGIPGGTMGERLKNAKKTFANYNDYNNLWFAHKVRNSIAHDVDHDLNSAEAKKAMEYFDKALRVLGVK